MFINSSMSHKNFTIVTLPGRNFFFIKYITAFRSPTIPKSGTYGYLVFIATVSASKKLAFFLFLKL